MHYVSSALNRTKVIFLSVSNNGNITMSHVEQFFYRSVMKTVIGKLSSSLQSELQQCKSISDTSALFEETYLYNSFIKAMQESLIDLPPVHEAPVPTIITKEEKVTNIDATVLQDNDKELGKAQLVSQSKGKGKPKVPCSWEGCDKFVALVDRKIEGKCYCSKHYERMSAKCKRLQANSKPSNENTVATQKNIPKEAVQISATNFDFRKHPPVDFLQDKNTDFWSLISYGANHNQRLCLNPSTNLVLNSCPVKQDQEGMLVGLHRGNQLILAKDLSSSILDWVRQSNITVILRNEEDDE